MQNVHLHGILAVQTDPDNESGNEIVYIVVEKTLVADIHLVAVRLSLDGDLDVRMAGHLSLLL